MEILIKRLTQTPLAAVFSSYFSQLLTGIGINRQVNFIYLISSNSRQTHSIIKSEQDRIGAAKVSDYFDFTHKNI